MRELLIFFAHLLTTIAKLLGPAGAKAIVADSLLMKQQLLVMHRSRRRAELGNCRWESHCRGLYQLPVAA